MKTATRMGHLLWLITLALVFFSGRTVEGQRCQKFPIGMSDRTKVKDDQITASSSLNRYNRPYHARIGSFIGDGWCAAYGRNKREYLEIDLLKGYVFCGVTVQGGLHGHVNSFELEFAREKGDSFTPHGKTFDRWQQAEQEKEFYSIAPFQVGQIVRFYPVRVTGLICARIELHGFPGPTIILRPDFIIAEFKKSYYPDLEASEMHLINTSCRAESENNTHITFHIPFKACGTTRIQTDAYMEYRNEIIRHITQGLITYKMDVNFPVTCRYDRNVTLGAQGFEVKAGASGGQTNAGSRLQSSHWSLVILWIIVAVLC